MTPMRRKTLRHLQLTRLQPVPYIRQIRRPPYHLGHQRRLGLLTEHQLPQRLRNREAGGELTHEVHPPGRVSDVLFVSDVGAEGLATARQDEGFDLLVLVGVDEGGEVFGGGEGDHGGHGGGGAEVVVGEEGFFVEFGSYDAGEASLLESGGMVEFLE
mmetsp:Transcript_21997/g.35008  ORF Transcript_21997/g.35008 Transcript_21997/m.35008 type:complete len:158 (+) Transcript_21997:337-810(+)